MRRSAMVMIALLVKRWSVVAIATCVLVPFLLVNLLVAPTPLLLLRNKSSVSSFVWSSPDQLPCYHPRPPLFLGSEAFCIGPCEHGPCFLRARRGICFSSSEVKLCERPLDLSRVPKFMRFRGENLTLPVVMGKACDRSIGKWVKGTSLVADQRMLPSNKPNPHHEAEKLVPATLFLQKLAPSNSKTRLYWFSPPAQMSQWARGFLQALHVEDKLVYVDLPGPSEPPLCFEDAVLFSPFTNTRYVPNEEYNAWLRSQVLRHCSIPIVNASWVPKRAVILNRSGARRLQNTHQIAEVLQRVLKVPVKVQVIGGGSFCHQVSQVATGDFFLVPHGSQNINLLFAPPGARVVEVFPYLFYNNALRNCTHAAQLRLYPLLGKRPPRDPLLWLFSLLGWDRCTQSIRWCKNYSRRQPVYVDLEELDNLLRFIVNQSSSGEQ